MYVLKNIIYKLWIRKATTARNQLIYIFPRRYIPLFANVFENKNIITYRISDTTWNADYLPNIITCKSRLRGKITVIETTRVFYKTIFKRDLIIEYLLFYKLFVV